MSLCKACAAPIAWVKLRSGKVNPVNWDSPQPFRLQEKLGPGAGALLTVVTVEGDVVRGYRAPVLAMPGQPPVRTVEGYISHFATCPEREAFRRAR